MFSCPGCGGEMRFEPSLQKLKCDHCDKLLTVNEYTMAHPTSNRMAVGEDSSLGYSNRREFDTYVFVCPQCGAELMTDQNTAATFCSYCGSSIQLQPRLTKAQAPDFVIPFMKTREDCVRSYRNLLARSIFAPSEFRKDDQIERFRGIYMPYWIYAFRKTGKVKTVGERSYRRGDYIYTDHYDIYFDVDSNCAGISYDASSYFADELSAGIAPFDMEQAQYFNPGYLSGFYADASDVNSKLYESDGKELIAKETAARAIRSMHTKSAIDLDVTRKRLEPDVTRTNLGFFPVWFLANQNKKGDRVSYAVVNGQTGRVAADIPISPVKFAIGTLICAVAFFIIMNLVFTLTPGKVAVVSVILAIVGWILMNRQLNQIYTRQHYLDDKGVQSLENANIGLTKKEKQNARRTSVRTKSSKPKSASYYVFMAIFFDIFITVALVMLEDKLKDFGLSGYGFDMLLIFYLFFGTGGWIAWAVVKIVNRHKIKKTTTKVYYAAPTSVKWKYCWKNLVSIVLCLCMIVFHPVYDAVNYAFVLVAIVLVGWSFFDMIRQHNELTCRPMPQFNKRGGEEYENRK